MGANIPRVYPWLGLLAGYLIVLFFNPIRLALLDGLSCILRFKRIWLTFVLLGFGYSVFQFATFTPLHGVADLDFSQVTAPGTWVFFFFQAEDGIRDYKVTGVQTCALPI